MLSFFLQFHFLREKMFYFLGSLCITCGISLDENGQIPRWYWRTPCLWYCNIGASRSFAFGEKEAWSWQQTQTVLHWSSDCAFWAKQEPPKLTGCSLTTGEGNWDDGTHTFSLALLHWGCQPICCVGQLTRCVSHVCMHVCIGDLSWRHPEIWCTVTCQKAHCFYSVIFPKEDSELRMRCWAAYCAVWWLVSFPQCRWTAPCPVEWQEKFNACCHPEALCKDTSGNAMGCFLR